MSETAAQENFSSNEKILSVDEPITFEPSELRYFILEVKEMIDNNQIIDLPKAIHNAKYFAEISRRIADVKADKNIVTFSDEEWEKFIDAQDIS